MKKLLLIWFFTLFTTVIWGQVYLDEAQNYSGTWTNQSNNGTGFSSWEIIKESGSTGNFISNPSNDGLESDGIGTKAFGLYGTGGSSYVHAKRELAVDFEIGDVFSFYWAINWDSKDGSKGFDLLSGGTTVFNMNNSQDSNITTKDGNVSSNYGVIPMKVTITKLSIDKYLLQMNRRFDGGGDYSIVIDYAGAIDGINFYVGAQNDNSGERNLYFNKLQLEKSVYPMPVVNFVLYKWSGALTPTSIKVNAKLALETTKARLVVSTSSDLNNPVFSDFITINATTNYVGAFSKTDLTPNTSYYYGIESDGKIDIRPEAIGQFKTAQEGAHSFSFLASSCNYNNYHPVYSKMKEKEAVFMMMHGDLHYTDPNSTDVDVHRAPYENNVLSAEYISDFYNQIPITYVWDDHDFAGNDSDANSTGANSAKQAYREYVPHYPFGTGIINENSAIYQSFVIGRVRFIMSDLRSEKTSNQNMGPEQLEWFKNECLLAKQNKQVICWASSYGVTADSSDAWGGTKESIEQRSEIFTFLNDSKINNLFIISGDAHAIGIDDGDNTDCAGVLDSHECPRNIDSINPRYPLFHAGPLGNNFTEKGVITNILPMSGVNQSGQYGKIDVVDTGGNSISINFTAYRVDPDTKEETVLATYNFIRELDDALDPSIVLSNPITFQSEWKYLDNGSDQGTDWKNNSFDDSEWSKGNAPLGYVADGIATSISYGGDAQNKHITSYFRKNFSVSNTKTISSASINLSIDDSAIIYLNGTEVAKANFDRASWDYQSLATEVVGSSPSVFSFDLKDLSLFKEGNNTLAVEVHQILKTSSDIYFDAKLSLVQEEESLSNTIFTKGDIKDSWVKVYPNPTKKLLHIQKIGVIKPKSIQIVDLNGRILKDLIWASEIETNKMTLDLSFLSSGTYVVKVNSNKDSQTYKFIKN